MSADRALPQDVGAEQAVLGACLLSEEAIEVARELLDESSWYHSPNSLVWQSMVLLHDAGVPVDTTTLQDELRRHGHLERAGGILYLTQLSTEVATWRNVRHHSQIVAEKALARHLIAACADAATQAYDGSKSPEEILQVFQSDLIALEQGHAQGEAEWPDVVAETVAAIERRAAMSDVLSGIPSGYDELDTMTDGWQPGDLILLAARPSVGKTALALSWVNAAAEAGQKVQVFSLEMGAQSLVKRQLAIRANIALHDIRQGRLCDSEWEKIAQETALIAALPISMNDKGGINPMEVRTVCRRVQRRSSLDLVVIDYLHLMTPSERSSTQEEEVGRISRSLKALAKELHVPIIALAQLSRSVESRPVPRPQLSDLRSSGQLEQDADVAMFIYRPEMYDLRDLEVNGQTVPSAGLAALDIAKQRNGPTGSVCLAWRPDFARYDPHPLTPSGYPDAAPPYMHHDNE